MGVLITTRKKWKIFAGSYQLAVGLVKAEAWGAGMRVERIVSVEKRWLRWHVTAELVPS